MCIMCLCVRVCGVCGVSLSVYVVGVVCVHVEEVHDDLDLFILRWLGHILLLSVDLSFRPSFV